MHEFYKIIYRIRDKIPKQARFGIWNRIETLCLEVLEKVIEAAFAPKSEKAEPLKLARVKIEILKRVIRLTRELDIIEDSHYLNLEMRLQEISKMLAGWLKFVER